MKIRVNDKFHNLLTTKGKMCELSYCLSRCIIKMYMREIHDLAQHYTEYAQDKFNLTTESVEYYVWETTRFDLLRCISHNGRFVYVKLPDLVKRAIRKQLKCVLYGRKYDS